MRLSNQEEIWQTGSVIPVACCKQRNRGATHGIWSGRVVKQCPDGTLLCKVQLEPPRLTRKQSFFNAVCVLHGKGLRRLPDCLPVWMQSSPPPESNVIGSVYDSNKCKLLLRRVQFGSFLFTCLTSDLRVCTSPNISSRVPSLTLRLQYNPSKFL